MGRCRVGGGACVHVLNNGSVLNSQVEVLLNWS